MSNTELEVGSSAPDFRLPSNTGGEIALSDYRGKKIVLFFVREYN
jgi:peroxiredoxin Q/BCP